MVLAIHNEDPVTLCLLSLWMVQWNITFYIVAFNLDKKRDSSTVYVKLGDRYLVVGISALL